MDTNTIDTVQTTTKIKRAYAPIKIDEAIAHAKRYVTMRYYQKDQRKNGEIVVRKGTYEVRYGGLRLAFTTLEHARAAHKAYQIERAVIQYFARLDMSLDKKELAALRTESQKWQGAIKECVAIMINLLEQLLTKKNVIVKH